MTEATWHACTRSSDSVWGCYCYQGRVWGLQGGAPILWALGTRGVWRCTDGLCLPPSSSFSWPQLSGARSRLLTGGLPWGLTRRAFTRQTNAWTPSWTSREVRTSFASMNEGMDLSLSHVIMINPPCQMGVALHCLVSIWILAFLPWQSAAANVAGAMGFVAKLKRTVMRSTSIVPLRSVEMCRHHWDQLSMFMKPQLISSLSVL